jgi:hypothetical protein
MLQELSRVSDCDEGDRDGDRAYSGEKPKRRASVRRQGNLMTVELQPVFTGTAVVSSPRLEPDALADYIIEWLQERNGAELLEAFEAMRVRDARNLREELVMILKHGGRPPNWTDK